MPTSLLIRFPWGRYHATPWGRQANEGIAEWPPSPWRILRALYATWLARTPEIDEAVVHGLLTSLAPPPSFRLPPTAEAHTRHFMPDTGTGRDKAFDPFVVFEPDAEVGVTWPTELRDAERDALAHLAPLVPYLGRAESVCDIQLVGDNPPDGAMCAPVASDTTLLERPPARVLVPSLPFDLASLVQRTVDVRRSGRLEPAGTAWISYELPPPPSRRPLRPLPRSTPVTAVRWALSAPARPSRRAAVAVADILRQAAMSRFGRIADGAASPTLAGKDAMGAALAGHRHAHYLALDADDDGLLDQVVVWAPAGFSEQELAALGRLDRLIGFGHVPDFRPTRLGLEAFGDIATAAPEITGPSRVWVSHTPFAPARHPKRRDNWEAHVDRQVRNELAWRGLPPPRRVELRRGDSLAYRRHRPTKETLHGARRAVGLLLEFDATVRGPISLGALSHFGLGLFVPSSGP